MSSYAPDMTSRELSMLISSIYHHILLKLIAYMKSNKLKICVKDVVVNISDFSDIMSSVYIIEY